MYLQGGSKPNEGNVMIKKSDYLGPICDDDWTQKQANVFCKQFGFKKADKIRIGSYFGKMKSDYAFDKFKCDGQEQSLYDCKRYKRSHCGPFDGAGVVCI